MSPFNKNESTEGDVNSYERKPFPVKNAKFMGKFSEHFAIKISNPK